MSVVAFPQPRRKGETASGRASRKAVQAAMRQNGMPEISDALWRYGALRFEAQVFLKVAEEQLKVAQNLLEKLEEFRPA